MRRCPFADGCRIGSPGSLHLCLLFSTPQQSELRPSTACIHLTADDPAAPGRPWTALQSGQFFRSVRPEENSSPMTEDPAKPVSRRLVPCDNEGIQKYARRRQPFNNMTVMYKRSAVLKVGGYKAMTRSEDYDLYVRILHEGYYCKNINDDLVFARIKENAADRRTSHATYRGFIKTRWSALRLGFSSPWDFLVACGAQTVVFLSPAFLQKLIYRKILHKPVGDSVETRILQQAEMKQHATGG